ncbi:hypothetical protein [Viridibacillus sp. FSL H8-0123]|uniref:hypothetical protein n=1 Tax=Viridibacillus sp. FSL H8-0123 TaxID=1928922 RepID=UPI00096F6D45|nr:hypothetical protein [Viridibacillus sp. FSL H8-0123]OMC83506.1 hypothetical protein BK130_08195 [Viridibacillus sp. FSL H8-0123]
MSTIIMYSPILLLILSYYFKISFIEHLHEGNKREARQAKILTIACFTLGIIPLILMLMDASGWYNG